MKKIITLVTAAALVLSIAACGGNETKEETTGETTAAETTTTASESSSSDAETTITIYQNKVEITEPLTAFGEAYESETGVKVEVKSAGGGTSYADSLIAAFQTKNQPDVFVIEGMGVRDL